MPFEIRLPRMQPHHDREMLRFHKNCDLVIMAIIFVRSFDSYQNLASEQYSTGFGHHAASNGTDLLLQHQKNLMFLCYAMGLSVISALLLLLAHLVNNTLAFDITLFVHGLMCLAMFFNTLVSFSVRDITLKTHSIATSLTDQVADAILMVFNVTVLAVFLLNSAFALGRIFGLRWIHRE